MRFKASLRRWLAPPRTKEDMLRRYRSLAAREAVVSLALLLVYFTVPAWASEADAPAFSALFLATSGMLASIAAATFWAAALIRRNVY